MIPLIAIGIAGVILSFVGALWMRKFKKDGYWMYVAGELAPVLGSFLVIGTATIYKYMELCAGDWYSLYFLLFFYNYATKISYQIKNNNYKKFPPNNKLGEFFIYAKKINVVYT
ncbi:MAG: hypothetical protein WDM90_13455 [Ferruginibacter sp.]